jgi:hypothetical protein
MDSNAALLLTVSEIALIGPESIKRRQVLEYPWLGVFGPLTLQVE